MLTEAQLKIVENVQQRIKLYEKEGLTSDEAVYRVWPELAPEEREVYDLIFAEIRSEVERIKRQWRNEDLAGSYDK